MKTYQKVLAGVAGVLALPFVAALFVANEYNVRREITVNKPKQEVFAYLRHLKNQEQYSKWYQLDPAMKKNFRGTDGTPGFVYAWDGNDDAGAGEHEIKGITEGEKIDTEVRFTRPFEGRISSPMITEAVSETETKVIFEANGSHSYPMNLMNLFMDGALGSDLETNLSQLKTKLETEAVTQR